jgi:hypothetical protein
VALRKIFGIKRKNNINSSDIKFLLNQCGTEHKTSVATSHTKVRVNYIDQFGDPAWETNGIILRITSNKGKTCGGFES